MIFPGDMVMTLIRSVVGWVEPRLDDENIVFIDPGMLCLITSVSLEDQLVYDYHSLSTQTSQTFVVATFFTNGMMLKGSWRSFDDLQEMFTKRIPLARFGSKYP